MKCKLLLPAFALFILAQFIFSCSNKEHFQFSATQPVSYHKTPSTPAIHPESGQNSPGAAISNEKLDHAKNEPVFEASIHPSASTNAVRKAVSSLPAKPVVMPEKISSLPAITSQEKILLQSVRKNLAGLNKSEKTVLKQNLNKTLPEGKASTNTILLVILAIILPPVAVALYEGITQRFWISLLLTLLLIVPGIIYSLLVVTGTI